MELQLNDEILEDGNQEVGSLLPLDMLAKLEELKVPDVGFQASKATLITSYFFLAPKSGSTAKEET